MKNSVSENYTRTITVAELCEALAGGTVQAKVEDDMYIVQGRDITRLTRAARGVMLPIETRPLQNSLQRAS